MPYPKQTKENKKIIKMKKEGKSFSEIGEELGVSKQAVHERYQKYKDGLSTD